MRNICDYSKEELKEKLLEIGEKPFRNKQVFDWIYHKGVVNFHEMLNLGKESAEKLAQNFEVLRPIVNKEQISQDGTRKWLIGFADFKEAETVFIPEVTRGTVCVSSQVGCTLTCKFCHTGTQKFVRNLTSGEILGQVMLVRDKLQEWPTPGLNDIRKISNIVLMGMGEPLYNFENVAKALEIIMDPEGINLSRKRITLSTSGVVPQFESCARRLGVNLAISLHAVRNELRDILVPLNKKYPIEDLLEECRKYASICPNQKITFEYVMLKGVNDFDYDAKELVRLIRGIPAKINIIPFNPWPGSNFECSEKNRIERFAEIIRDAGYPSPVRTPRGQDILAACGQLRSDSIKASKSILQEVMTEA
jgi:23S rRNA (adenine2503-C2)-methyltransferase